MRSTGGRTALAVGVGAAVLALLAGMALTHWHEEGDGDGRLHACRNETNGTIRLVSSDEDCRPHEHPVSCDICAQPGPGLVSFDALNGLGCTANGASGTISITYASNGVATITCVTAPGADGGVVDGGMADAGSTELGGLKVNEVLLGRAVTSDPQYVEIYNASGTDLDASGVRLVYRSATGTTDTLLGTIAAGTTIPSGGFYLFANPAFTGPADQRFTSRLAPSGGGVGLRDSSGTLLDSVGWAAATNAFVEGTPAANAGATGDSIGRIPDGTDTNDNSLDFHLTQQTPGAQNAL